MVTSGVLHPEERVELIDGDIIDATPQSSFHSVAVGLVEDALRTAFGSTYCVRVQMPLALDELSEPEPDIAIVLGNPRDYRDAHPNTALLVVEVADSALVFDQGRKLALYARNGIPEYWVVNLVNNCLEVYQSPERDSYRSHATLQANDSVQPLACSHRSIGAADLLP
jgi:Uma2 family endonuclease